MTHVSIREDVSLLKTENPKPPKLTPDVPLSPVASEEAFPELPNMPPPIPPPILGMPPREKTPMPDSDSAEFFELHSGNR